MNQLPAVMPATDWLGIGIIFALVVVFVSLVGYIVHIKRTPGKQLGEEELDRLASLIVKKQEVVHTVSVPTAPLTFDGITFADQSKLDEYRQAKAVVDAAKGGTP